MAFVNRHLFRGTFNMYDRYSIYSERKKSWAVVTGGSDGIGLEICHQMAA